MEFARKRGKGVWISSLMTADPGLVAVRAGGIFGNLNHSGVHQYIYSDYQYII